MAVCSRNAVTPVRLKRRAEFLAVQKGDRVKGPLFLLETLRQGDPNAAPRVGFTVTRKQGNAVERNRIRRRLREAVRLVGAKMMLSGCDYVFIGRRDILSASFSRLTSTMKDRIQRANRMAVPERRDQRLKDC